MGTPVASGVQVIFDRWDEVVGPGMAARTRPAHIDRGTLVVACEEPGVATHLRYLQAELLQRLTQLTGDSRIQRIEVKVEGRRRRSR